MPDGRRQVTGFADPGHFLGLAAIDRYGFSAEALTPLKLCRFTHDGMKLLMTQFPALEQRILRETSRDLAQAQGHTLLLGRKTARERLASFLVELGRKCPQSNAIELSMTRTDIADYLGLTIETVSRTLNALRRDGLIDIEHVTGIRLKDREALRALAAGE
jgi:CRP/FNR family transcriptional regulator